MAIKTSVALISSLALALLLLGKAWGDGCGQVAKDGALFAGSPCSVTGQGGTGVYSDYNPKRPVTCENGLWCSKCSSSTVNKTLTVKTYDNWNCSGTPISTVGPTVVGTTTKATSGFDIGCAFATP